MTRRAHLSHNTRWLLRGFLDQPWAKDALCKFHPTLPWTGHTEPALVKGEWTEKDTAPTREEQITMRALCNSCPGQTKCALFALEANYGHGIDGGFYAGVYMPWRSYYRERNPNLAERRHAKELLRQVLK